MIKMKLQLLCRASQYDNKYHLDDRKCLLFRMKLYRLHCGVAKHNGSVLRHPRTIRQAKARRSVDILPTFLLSLQTCQLSMATFFFCQKRLATNRVTFVGVRRESTYRSSAAPVLSEQPRLL